MLQFIRFVLLLKSQIPNKPDHSFTGDSRWLGNGFEAAIAMVCNTAELPSMKAGYPRGPHPCPPDV
ncbi:hypothetical protein EMIT0111MI5_20261 [Burkholderia sp. IT-111MI5]